MIDVVTFGCCLLLTFNDPMFLRVHFNHFIKKGYKPAEKEFAVFFFFSFNCSDTTPWSICVKSIPLRLWGVIITLCLLI